MSPELIVTGLGVTSSIGQGKDQFAAALMEGRHRFAVMQRPGRQKETAFLGAEIPVVDIPNSLPKAALRTVSFSGQVALVTLHEAWHDAHLDDVDPVRIGLVVGGSNVQQRDLTLIHDAYRDRESFLRPTYGVGFMDSDLCGACTAHFAIHGFAYTVGGASASGQLAVLEAMRAVRAGDVDVCIALGALMDLSYWECQGFRSLGAMGSDRYADCPELASRPFDRQRDGFIFGENCGAVVVERADKAGRAGTNCYARIAGGAMRMDGNRNPDPSLHGEVAVIRSALSAAGISARDVDYVKPHGTGSIVGDETELQALRDCGLAGVILNTTKSIIGHGLTSAGAVEIVAALLQMQAGQLHPCRNLSDPIDAQFNWVRDRPMKHTVRNLLTLSMGFGGINTAICFSSP